MSAKSRVGGKGKGKGKKRRTINARCDIVMPVRRIRKYITDGRYSKRMKKETPIFMAAVLEYLVAEVLELAGNAAKDHNKKTINPRHIMLGIKNDEELNKLCDGVIFPKAGVIVHINEALTKKQRKLKKKAKLVSSQVL